MQRQIQKTEENGEIKVAIHLEMDPKEYQEMKTGLDRELRALDKKIQELTDQLSPLPKVEFTPVLQLLHSQLRELEILNLQSKIQAQLKELEERLKMKTEERSAFNEADVPPDVPDTPVFDESMPIMDGADIPNDPEVLPVNDTSDNKGVQ